MITIRPIPFQDSAALADWHAQMETLLALSHTEWTRDQYATLNALIVEAFAVHGVTHLIGQCERDADAPKQSPHAKAHLTFWKEIAEGRLAYSPRQTHPELIQTSGWWYENAGGRQLLKWEWIRWANLDAASA